jgi:hypothetical protein
MSRILTSILLLLALLSPLQALTITTLDVSIPTTTSSIAIGTAQVEWLLTLDVNTGSGAIQPRTVYLTAPVAWTFSYTSGGTQYPVNATSLMRIDLAAASTTFFVTGASSSTLSLYATPIGSQTSGGVVTGTTIDASVIGGSSPAAGTFTAVTANTGSVKAADGLTLGTDVAGGTTNIPGYLKLWSNGDNAFFSSFVTPTQTASAAYTLPTAPATVAGQVLTDAAANGVLSWATPSGGGITGSLTATRIPVASGASTLVDYATFTTNGTTLTINTIAIGKGNNARAGNMAFGTSALATNTTGTYNKAFGEGALQLNTTGSYNGAMGQCALQHNTIGGANYAIGDVALQSNTEGCRNNAHGDACMTVNTLGTDNDAYGDTALGTNILGSHNAAFGGNAGYAVSDGNYCTYMGWGTTGPNGVAITNSTAIGNGATLTADNQVMLGNTSVTNVTTTGTISTPGINLTVPSGAGTYSGTITTLTSTETQALGDAVQIDSAGKCHLAKADSLAHASAVFICVSAPSGSASATYAMPGSIIKLAASASWTAGNVIYLSVTGTTTNTLTKTAPSTSTNIVQILGVALANDTLLFQPSLVQVTVL